MKGILKLEEMERQEEEQEARQRKCVHPWHVSTMVDNTLNSYPNCTGSDLDDTIKMLRDDSSYDNQHERPLCEEEGAGPIVAASAKGGQVEGAGASSAKKGLGPTKGKEEDSSVVGSTAATSTMGSTMVSKTETNYISETRKKKKLNNDKKRGGGRKTDDKKMKTLTGE